MFGWLFRRVIGGPWPVSADAWEAAGACLKVLEQDELRSAAVALDLNDLASEIAGFEAAKYFPTNKYVEKLSGVKRKSGTRAYNQAGRRYRQLLEAGEFGEDFPYGRE